MKKEEIEKQHLKILAEITGLHEVEIGPTTRINCAAALKCMRILQSEIDSLKVECERLKSERSHISIKEADGLMALTTTWQNEAEEKIRKCHDVLRELKPFQKAITNIRDMTWFPQMDELAELDLDKLKSELPRIV